MTNGKKSVLKDIKSGTVNNLVKLDTKMLAIGKFDNKIELYDFQSSKFVGFFHKR